MLQKYIIGFVLILMASCHAQNPVEELYDAYNKKNWKKFERLLHKDFKGYSNGQCTTPRDRFFSMCYRDDVWEAEWKILSQTETAENIFLVTGTFTDEYDMFLYGAPREGKWNYTVKDKKIWSIEWLDFPENPNQKRGEEREKEFYDWIALNYPDHAGINRYWSQDTAMMFRDLFRKYRKGRE